MIVRSRVLLLAVLVTVGIIYSLGIHGPLVLDDVSNLAPLERLHSSNVPWYVVVFGNSSGALGRSISMVTFLADYWMHGFDVTWFKITNIIIHLGCGLAVYFFLVKALEEAGLRLQAKNYAAIASSLWLLSPLFTSTVLYVIQRMAMLSALFTLLALQRYLCFRDSLATSAPKYAYLAQFFVFWVLGLFAKENAALMPLFVLVLEIFFCEKLSRNEAAYRKKNLLILVVSVIPLLVAFALILHKPQIVLDYSKRSFTLSQRFFTECRILWDYILSLLVPQSNQFGLFHDDIFVSKGLLSPLSTLFAVLGWAGVIMAAIFAARRNDKWRPLAGGVGFFLIGHALESTVLPLELYFEHRNYLPGVGIYLSLVLGAACVIDKGWITAQVVRLAAYAYGVVICFVLIQRVMIWSDFSVLIYSSYEAHPLSPRANVETALLDARMGKFEAAQQKIDKVKTLLPKEIMGANTQLIYIYCLLNRGGLTSNDVQMMADVTVDDTNYASTGLGELNNLYREHGCSNVPYAEYMLAMSNRISRFYDSDEYKAYNERRLMGVASVNLRIMEGLNSLARTDKTIELAEKINKAGQGGFAIDLLTAVALIDQGRMQEAGQLIQKQKQDASMSAQFEAKSLANIEQIYNDRMKSVQ